jgi:hypothetical protein
MDFAAAFATWMRVLTQPGVPVFEQEKSSPNANLTTAIIWIVVAAIISGILSWLNSLLFSGLMSSMVGSLPPQFQGMTGAGYGLWAIIIVPVIFVLIILLMHVVAQALGGQGEMGVLAYLVAAYQAPIYILSSIPVISCFGILFAIYGVVLSYFAVQANYGLSSGKAIVVALVPLVLGICVGGAITSVLVGTAMAGA